MIHGEKDSFIDSLDQMKRSFRFIDPKDFPRYGIDPSDVPLGTFAAEDHPNFLLSRYGGNAYGFGLAEQSKLNASDLDFLQSIDLDNREMVMRHALKINSLYRKLGLLIRFSRTGFQYFLIPVNLVAQSLQDIRSKVEEIEELVAQHIRETGIERLDIGLMASPKDLITDALVGRLSPHRLFVFENLQKILSWRTPLDVVLFPRDPMEYLLSQQLPRPQRATPRYRRFLTYAAYLAKKVHAFLEDKGLLIILTLNPRPQKDQESYLVEFHTELEEKRFLLFNRIFRSNRVYHPGSSPYEVDALDFHNYLNQVGFTDIDNVKELKGRPLTEWSLEAIDALPSHNRPFPLSFSQDFEKRWQSLFSPYFHTSIYSTRLPKSYRAYWLRRIRVRPSLPQNLLMVAARPIRPQVSLHQIHGDVRRCGMQGCALPLVASYRNTFRYVFDVLQALVDIRDGRMHALDEVQRERLLSAFKSKGNSNVFHPLRRLIQQARKLRKICHGFNPDGIEGPVTPVLENLPSLSLHGFTRDQLKELFLIVVGHSSMSRVVFGKMPAKSLSKVIDSFKHRSALESIDNLRYCCLMTLAEIAASLDGPLTESQVAEIFRVYEDAVRVATQSKLSWKQLTDHRISEWGGVQYKAIREMLKFFNLFEFLDTWYHHLNKGPCEIEVTCDYDVQKLSKLHQALKLAHAANQFRSRYLQDRFPRQTYFFRQFLETEFHGTGHLFPQLGPDAGFILLWITVNVSERRIINLNPILSGISPERSRRRIEKIRRRLLNLPEEALQPKFLEALRQNLAQGHPAFVHRSGIRLMHNSTTKATDVFFVDVHENLELLHQLLIEFETQKLRDIPLLRLNELERLFAELDSYRDYLDQVSADPLTPNPIAVNEKIETVKARIKDLFFHEIFVPEEIYDTISLLATHCPHILKFLLPEFHALGNLFDYWPTRKKQSVGTYVMRCLLKFQALITKDRESFQDQDTFYQSAKHEFGPLAEEGLGVKHSQLEILEDMVERLQENPVYYQALTLALLFQDIGKVDYYAQKDHDVGKVLTHAEKSAMILESSQLLDRYPLNDTIKEAALHLVRHHGIFGHVLQGEEPITALEKTISDRDPILLDAMVLHSILAAASVEEGLMTEDLLDLFLNLRNVALELIKNNTSWKSWLEDFLREKGEALVSEKERQSFSLAILMSGSLPQDRSPENWQRKDLALDRGRRIATFERLLSLFDLKWVDCQDLEMSLLGMPTAFIHHKKGLKSLGVHTFTSQLSRAMQLLEVLSELEESCRDALLHCLDPLYGPFRIYDFHPLARYLGVSTCVKLLIMACQVHHHMYRDGGEGIVSFRPLSQVVRKKKDMIEEITAGLHQRCPIDFSHQESKGRLIHRGLVFEVFPRVNGIRVTLEETDQIEHLLNSLTTIWDHETLHAHYRNLVSELQKLPYDTSDHLSRCKRVYQYHTARISRKILEELQAELEGVRTFEDFEKMLVRVQALRQKGFMTREYNLLLQEMVDYHQSRLREEYLGSLFTTLASLTSKTDLQSFWHKAKVELHGYRSYVGKEYEILIAAYIDEKMENMED